MIHTSQQAFIISNPMAGGNQSRAIKHLQSLGLSFDLTATQAAGHAEALALQASQDGYRFIIALGGDGTIHEVVNGMLRNPCNQSTLGWIPSGTANDYAASFSCDFLESLDKSPACVDVGCIRWHNNARYFANVAGIGLSGAVATCARSMSRLPARIKYSLSLLSQLGSQYGARELSICIDEEPTQPAREVLLLSVAHKPPANLPYSLPTHRSQIPIAHPHPPRWRIPWRCAGSRAHTFYAGSHSPSTSMCRDPPPQVTVDKIQHQ